MKKIKIFLIIILIVFVNTACYFTNVPIYPSAAAFHHVQDSPFRQGGERITGLATDGDIAVAVSYSGTIAWSEDHGISWHTVDTETIVNTLPGGIRFNAVTWGEGYFLAGGDGGKAAYSKDGKIWQQGVIGPMSPKNILTVAIGEMRRQIVFIAAGNDGRIAYALNSPEGPWTHVSNSPFGDRHNHGETINSVVYGKIKGSGIFVAVGENGKYAVLNDFSGEMYGPTTVGTRQNLNSVIFGNERFISVGDGATIRISADPGNYRWTTIRDHEFGMRPFLTIGYNPNIEYFILISKNNDGTPVVGFSPNGENWSAFSMASHFVRGISAVVCTRKRIILGGEDGMMVYSN